MKIARVFTGDINNQKGKFNNVIERIKHLDKVEDVESDNYLIQYHYTWSFRLLKPIKNRHKFEQQSKVDGVNLINIWVEMSLLEYLLVHKFKLKDIECKQQLNKHVSKFKKYDIIASHDLLSTYLATQIKKKFKIPFVVTWHGSDINKYPYRSKKTYNFIKFCLEQASMNFFVSKALQRKSDEITQSVNKTYLYTGPSNIFYKKTLDEVNEFKVQLNITTKYVVGFIGNLEPIKNVLTLPSIFYAIQNELKDVSFLIIGDGRLKRDLENGINSIGVSNIFYTGNVLPTKIPDYINVMNVLLLPSLNEGLPMVTLEALSCGVQVIGSNVGGIPEVIGKENCFELYEDFEKNVANKIIDILLKNQSPQKLNEEFSWDKAIEKEVAIYQSVTGILN